MVIHLGSDDNLLNNQMSGAKSTLTVLSMLAVVVIMFSIGASTLTVAEEADDTVIVDHRSGEGDVSTLHAAVSEVGDGGEILVRQPSDRSFAYEGTVVGADHPELSDGKSVTIRGDGAVAIEGLSVNSNIALDVSSNQNRHVEVENIMFVDADHAVTARSNAEVTVDNIAVGSTVTDTPFVLHRNLAGVSSPGAYIENKGTYYADNHAEFSETGIAEAWGGELQLDEVEPDPFTLIYERVNEPLDQNPVTEGEYGEREVLRVGDPVQPGIVDDDDINTNYETLQRAVDDASPGAHIYVYPKENNNPYDETVEITGSSISGSHKLQITGRSYDHDEAQPIVDDIEIKYHGEYQLRQLQISGDVTAGTDNIDVDARENYWFDSESGPTDDEAYVPDGTYATITTEPFCADDHCDQLTTDDIDMCLDIETGDDSLSLGCDTYDDTLSININPYEPTELYDFYESDIEVDSEIEDEQDIDIRVHQSDDSTDKEIVADEDSSMTSKMESQFSSELNNLLPGEEKTIRPLVIVDVDGLDPVSLRMSEFTLTGVGDETDRLANNIGQGAGSITTTNFEGIIEDQDTYVSRFNDGDDGHKVLEDNIIPPTETVSGDELGSPYGSVEYFSRARTDTDRGAIITPDQDELRVGMSVQNTPTADGHTLNIVYGLQSEDSVSNNIGVNIVNQQNDEIYSTRSTQLDVTSDSEEPFSSTEDLDTYTAELPLHSTETEFVNSHGTMYAVFENMDIHEDSVFVIYEMYVESTDNVDFDDQDIEQSSNVSDGSDDLEGDSPEATIGDLLVTFDVEGSQNTEYGTYDIEPNEDLTVTATIENQGDTTIEDEFAVVDEYEIPSIRYPNEDTLDGSYSAQEEIVDTFNIRVAPGETENVPVSLNWDEAEFGNHSIQFMNYEDGELQELDEDASTPSFDVYVYQTTTMDIVDIDVPDEYITYDGFNAEIEVKNIGDLSGERELSAEYGEWTGITSIELGGGDARSNESSETTTVRFDRDGDDIDFNRREYTTPGDVVDHMYTIDGPFEVTDVEFTDSDTDTYFRMNAPFHTETGNHSFDAVAANEFDGNIFSDVQDALRDDGNEDYVELYELIINDLRVSTADGDYTQRPTSDEGTVQASAYPYVFPSFGLSENPSVMSREGTMFSSDSGIASDAVNRGAHPLNEGILSQPDGEEFGHYYSHENRYCNENSPEDVFLPFSADDCEDNERFTQLHLPRFAGTTAGDTTDDIEISHPEEDFIVEGVNPETYEDADVMVASVSVSNPSDAHPVTARVEIVSDRSIDSNGYAVGLGEEGAHQEDLGDDSFDDNVLGVAAVELQPEQVREVDVPFVVKNDEANDGVHVISVQPRHDDDYIKLNEDAADPQDMPESPITGEHHSQFEVPIEVETFGDSVLVEHEPVLDREADDGDPELAQEADLVVNNICDGGTPRMTNRLDGSQLLAGYSPSPTEGLNPISGHQEENWGVSRTDGDCITEDNTVAQFESTYQNFGGDAVDVEFRALSNFDLESASTTLHRNQAQLRGDIFFADYGDEDEHVTTYAEHNTPREATISPGESYTYNYERQFHEPGLYHVRASPCRMVDEDGPQHYNLEGFIGIPDASDDVSTWFDGVNRDSGVTTNEMSNSVFHGARGCSDAVTSVFVYDVTEPVADFRLTHSESAIEDNTLGSTRTESEDQTPDDALQGDEEHDTDETFEVYEGGMLYFDGSTADCEGCYPTETPSFIDVHWDSELSESNLASERMSQSNTRITDMEWMIDGDVPNWGDERACNQVDSTDPDETCYMDRADGDGDLSVVTHRFNDAGTSTVSLQVWDDPELTEGAANTDTTTHDVEVLSDDDDPDVSISSYTVNDLSYADDDGLDYAEPIWHRNEEVIEYASLNDMDHSYSNTYEGVRTCFTVGSSDDQIGISQDAWYNIGEDTYVTDEDGYWGMSGVHGVEDAGEVDTFATRDGDRRCVVFEEADGDRTHTVEYEAWDFAENSNTDEETVDVVSDNSAPTITEFDHSYSGHFGHESSTDYVWAADSGTGYSGGTVSFDITGSDSGIGLACLDLRANPTETTCQSREGGSSDSWSDSFSASSLDYYTSDWGEGRNTATEESIATDWHSNTDSDTTAVEVMVDETSPDISGGSNTGNHYDYSRWQSPGCESETVEGDWDADGPAGGTEVYTSSISYSGDGSADYDITGVSGGSGDITVTFTWCWDDEASASCSVTCEECGDDEPDCNCDDCEDEDSDTCGEEDECDDDDTYTEDASGTATITIEDRHGNTNSADFDWDASMEDYDTDSDSCDTTESCSCDTTDTTCDDDNQDCSNNDAGHVCYDE